MTRPPTPEAARLASAAQEVIDRWNTPLWKDAPATALYITHLQRAVDAHALASQSRPAADEASEWPACDGRTASTCRDQVDCEIAGRCLAAKADMSTPAPQIDASAGCVDSVSVPRASLEMILRFVDRNELGIDEDIADCEAALGHPPAESTDGLAKGDAY